MITLLRRKNETLLIVVTFKSGMSLPSVPISLARTLAFPGVASHNRAVCAGVVAETALTSFARSF